MTVIPDIQHPSYHDNNLSRHRRSTVGVSSNIGGEDESLLQFHERESLLFTTLSSTFLNAKGNPKQSLIGIRLDSDGIEHITTIVDIEEIDWNHHSSDLIPTKLLLIQFEFNVLPIQVLYSIYSSNPYFSHTLHSVDQFDKKNFDSCS